MLGEIRWRHNACAICPSCAGEAIVGATSTTDRIAWFSGWGSCIDLYTPAGNARRGTACTTASV